MTAYPETAPILEDKDEKKPTESGWLLELVVDSTATLNPLSATMPKRPHSGGHQRAGQGHVREPLMFALR